ncbi:hypothetical protein DFH09DRAFT_1492595 [Mycena vulgaris]|nr:hypothetical protein DFH09DRAFT_1492595 [Mycena vulgaris]
MPSVFLTPTSVAGTHIHGVTLPNDILNHFLAASPSFDTLHAAVRVCKTWHGVFTTPPQAVRVLRHTYPEKTPYEWGSRKEKEDSDATEDHTADEDDALKNLCRESDDIGELSPEERMRLQKNAAIVNQLEEIFSFKHKDRISKTSRLTVLESRCFTCGQRDVPRHLVLRTVLPPAQLRRHRLDEDEPEELEEIQKARHAMLNECTTPELLEIRAVVAFLHELIGEAVDEGDTDRLPDICTPTGLGVILEAYLTKSTAPFEETLEAELTNSGEHNALFALPPSEWDALSDEVCGQNDGCAQCGVVAGLNLLVEPHSRLIHVDFCALLLGNLGKNGRVVVVAEIYDLKTLALAAWKKNESLCSSCLQKLIGAHLHLWLYKRKVQDGRGADAEFLVRVQLHEHDADPQAQPREGENCLSL